MITLSTHAIAEEYKKSRDPICIVLKVLVSAHAQSHKVFRSTEHIDNFSKSEVYDTPIAAFKLFCDNGLAAYLYVDDKEECFYFFDISEDVSGTELRDTLAEKLLAAPDRKIIIPTCTEVHKGELTTYIRQDAEIRP